MAIILWVLGVPIIIVSLANLECYRPPDEGLWVLVILVVAFILGATVTSEGRDKVKSQMTMMLTAILIGLVFGILALTFFYLPWWGLGELFERLS
ncbi:MAG: hypothetical protein AB1744_08150 [Candidatus Zixiibacteriota bacterium]